MAHLVTLWNFRGLLYALTLLRLRVRYKQSVLGWFWAVLQPLSLMVIYTFLFSRVTAVNTGHVPYPLFVLSGLLPWIFLASSISTAGTGLVNHSYLITRVYFPREIIPLSYIAAALADFLIALLIFAALMLYYGTFLIPNAFVAAPIMFFVGLLATGASLLLSALQARIRDFGIGIPLFLQLWMFATPVVYPLDVIPGTLRTVCMLNPVTGLIEGFRGAILEGKVQYPSVFLYSIVSSAMIFIIGYVVFKVLDANMADVI